MIRRSVRIIKQEAGSLVTRYEVTRVHIFGFCIYVNQRELDAYPADPVPGCQVVTGQRIHSQAIEPRGETARRETVESFTAI